MTTLSQEIIDCFGGRFKFAFNHRQKLSKHISPEKAEAMFNKYIADMPRLWREYNMVEVIYRSGLDYEPAERDKFYESLDAQNEYSQRAKTLCIYVIAAELINVYKTKTLYFDEYRNKVVDNQEQS